MKNLLLVPMVLFALGLVTAQDLPPKHRGELPTLKADGKVVDKNGKQLGYITKEGKVCDVSGKVIGIISAGGDVTTASGKGIIGAMQKDGSLKTHKVIW